MVQDDLWVNFGSKIMYFFGMNDRMQEEVK